MYRHIDGWHSPHLGKQMEIVTYGEYGFPLLMFPTAAADYLEYERFHVITVLEEFINKYAVLVMRMEDKHEIGLEIRHDG